MNGSNDNPLDRGITDEDCDAWMKEKRICIKCGKEMPNTILMNNDSFGLAHWTIWFKEDRLKNICFDCFLKECDQKKEEEKKT